MDGASGYFCYPSRLNSISGNRDPVYTMACLERRTRCGAAVLDQLRAGVQKVWDALVVSQKYEELLSATQNQAGVPDLLRLLLLILATS